MPVNAFGGGAYDRWCWGSKLQLRHSSLSHIAGYRYRIEPYAIYPKKRYISTLKRNGYNHKVKNDNKISIVMLMKGLLKYPAIETLWKAKNYEIVKYALEDDRQMNTVHKYWNQLRIAMKHKYKFPHFHNYIDYLRQLKMFNKDMNNPHYICPKDFYVQHQKYNKLEAIERKRLRDIEDAKAKAERMKRIRSENSKYMKRIKKFVGLVFTDKRLVIEPIKTVYQLRKESDILIHCAFNSEYYLKEESLLLSARINNKPIETIEFKLNDGTIEQARGFDNKASKHHKRIINLMEKNKKEILNIHENKKKKEIA